MTNVTPGPTCRCQAAPVNCPHQSRVEARIDPRAPPCTTVPAGPSDDPSSAYTRPTNHLETVSIRAVRATSTVS